MKNTGIIFIYMQCINDEPLVNKHKKQTQSITYFAIIKIIAKNDRKKQNRKGKSCLWAMS